MKRGSRGGRNMTQVSSRSKSYQQQEPGAAGVVSSRRRLMNNLLINLPEDVLIHNILLKVPMKSLLNLRCVCSSLRCLITSPAFVNMHLYHSTITLNKHLVLIIPSYPSLYLNRDPSDKTPNMFYSLNFNATDDPSRPERVEVRVTPNNLLMGGEPSQYSSKKLYFVNFNATDHDGLSHPERVLEITTPFRSPHIFGSCNGLLCLSDRYAYHSPCIWNPATKEYKKLPSPSLQNPFGDTQTFHSSLYFGFGYDSTISDYKVIRCENFTCSKGQNSITEFQVYTLGTNTWRKINTGNNPYSSYFLAPKRQGLFVNGALHWIMSTTSNTMRGSAIEARIISLDIKKEKFQELQKPHHQLMVGGRTWELQVLRGCLCIHEEVSMKIIKIDVWMMNDYGVKDSWTKLFTIVEPLAVPCWYEPMNFYLLNFFENGEILIGMNRIPLIIYDPVKDEARYVDKLRGLHSFYRYKGIHMETLVSLKSVTWRDREQVSKEFKMEQTEKNKNNKKRKILPDCFS